MPARRFLLAVAVATASWAFAETITVRPGDTLWALAQRYDTSVEALMEANGLSRPDLRPGDSLALPGSAAARPEVWTVRSGDTLYDIAREAGTTVEQLTAWNDLTGSLLRPGQELLLGAPAGPASAAAPADPTPLTIDVRPGDTLWRIGREHDVSPDAIAAANGIAVDATLHPGDDLVVPGRFVASDAPADQGGYAAPTITVDPGDTLWEIARRYDTTVAALMAANGLDGATLRAGQELRIVGRDDSGTVSAAVRDQPRPPAAARDLMLWPLRGPITSPFGWRPLRIGGTNMHYGIDIDGQTGDPIVAATAGQVTFAGWMGGYGKLVIVERGATEYYYAHASELLVREGQRVDVGQIVARVGTTGRVTGSHLHFEIRENGSPVDPMPVLEARAGRP
jgi:murein DD-endopeptidase MepM/ murein hydrolase activator NlpD